MTEKLFTGTLNYNQNKTKKLYTKNDATVLGVSIGLDTPNEAALFLSVNGNTSNKSMAHCSETTRSAMLFFEVLPFTDKKQCDVVRCV